MAMISDLVYPELKTTQRLNYTGSNFPVWKMKVSFVIVDNHVDYVLTEPKPPKATDDTPKEEAKRRKKWLADDLACRHLMLGAMDDDLYLNFHPYPTAKALMDALNARFNSSSMARRMVLFRKYMENRMVEDAPIHQHILEMGAMAHELQMAGVPVPDELQAVVLMNSLPESMVNEIGGLIVRMDKDLTLDNVTRRLRIMGELKDWKARENEAETSNYSSKNSKKIFKGNCFACGNSGHYQADCPYSDFY